MVLCYLRFFFEKTSWWVLKKHQAISKLSKYEKSWQQVECEPLLLGDFIKNVFLVFLIEFHQAIVMLKDHILC